MKSSVVQDIAAGAFLCCLLFLHVPLLFPNWLDHIDITRVNDRKVDTAFSILDQFHTTVTMGQYRPRALDTKTGNKEESCPKCPRRKCQPANYYRDQVDCKCKPCAAGQNPNSFGDKCVNDADNNKDKQGQCPAGQVLDQAEGGQDKTTPNPKCYPDDSAKCPPGEIPASREKTDTGPKDQVSCAKDAEEKDKPTCKSNEYQFVQVTEGIDGKKTVYSCHKTRKNDRDKDGKFEETRLREKAGYDERKRVEEEKRKDDEKKRLEEEQNNRNHNKKARMGKCLTIVPLAFSTVGATLLTNEYFDEIFVTSEDMIHYWPPDLAEVPAVDIDSTEYLEKFMAAVNANSWIGEYVGPGKRSIDPPDVVLSNTTDLIEVLQSTEIGHFHKKRVLQALIVLILGFLGRVAPILARVGVGAARLAGLVKNGGVKLAKAGQGKAPSRKAMKDNADYIVQNKNWRRCIEGLDPLSL